MREGICFWFFKKGKREQKLSKLSWNVLSFSVSGFFPGMKQERSALSQSERDLRKNMAGSKFQVLSILMIRPKLILLLILRDFF
jgi:hypothetical protein